MKQKLKRKLPIRHSHIKKSVKKTYLSVWFDGNNGDPICICNFLALNNLLAVSSRQKAYGRAKTKLTNGRLTSESDYNTWKWLFFLFQKSIYHYLYTLCCCMIPQIDLIKMWLLWTIEREILRTNWTLSELNVVQYKLELQTIASLLCQSKPMVK